MPRPRPSPRRLASARRTQRPRRSGRRPPPAAGRPGLSDADRRVGHVERAAGGRPCPAIEEPDLAVDRGDGEEGFRPGGTRPLRRPSRPPPGGPIRAVAASYTISTVEAPGGRRPSGLKATPVVESPGPPSASPIAWPPSMLHATAERRCEVTSVRPSGLNATWLTAPVSAVNGAVRPARLRVPDEDRSPERARGQQSALRAEGERRHGLVALPTAARRAAVPSLRRPGHGARVVARDQSPAAVGEDRRLRLVAPDRERRADATARGHLPDADGAGRARRRSASVRAERDRLRARPRRVRGDRPADHPAGLRRPERDVVLLLRTGSRRRRRAEPNRRARSPDLAGTGSASSHSSFLVATSHSSTPPSPPAIASVRPSGLKSAPCHRP